MSFRRQQRYREKHVPSLIRFEIVELMASSARFVGRMATSLAEVAICPACNEWGTIILSHTTLTTCPKYPALPSALSCAFHSLLVDEHPLKTYKQLEKSKWVKVSEPDFVYIYICYCGLIRSRKLLEDYTRKLQTSKILESVALKAGCCCQMHNVLPRTYHGRQRKRGLSALVLRLLTFAVR